MVSQLQAILEAWVCFEKQSRCRFFSSNRDSKTPLSEVFPTMLGSLKNKPWTFWEKILNHHILIVIPSYPKEIHAPNICSTSFLQFLLISIYHLPTFSHQCLTCGFKAAWIHTYDTRHITNYEHVVLLNLGVEYRSV